MFLYVILDWAFGKWFRSSWMTAQESGSGARRRRGIGMFRLSRRPALMLVMKDLKTFVRDPVQWSQCAIIFGVLAIYILNLRTFRYHRATPMWKNMVAFLNLTATCLSLATLTTRFVFPMISLEGRRFWILGLMPLSRWDVLRAKFAFVLFGSLFVTITLAVLSNSLLGVSSPIFVLQLATASMVSIGLSGLAVGMGVMFPNLKESDPSKIVSGFGGTLTLVLSMCYVGMVVVAVLIPCHMFIVRAQITGRGFGLGISISMAIAALLTMGVGCLPLWFGRRAFERLEV
jgi:ABC-2 type transport system permease protein